MDSCSLAIFWEIQPKKNSQCPGLAAAPTTTIWQRAVAGEPVVVDVDKAAEEPTDQEPLGRPAEDKEAELDAKKRALDERERDLRRRGKMPPGCGFCRPWHPP